MKIKDEKEEKDEKDEKQKNQLKRNGKKLPKWKIVLLLLVIVCIIMGVAAGVYLSQYYHSRYTLEEYQKSSKADIVEANSTITIKGDSDNGIGIIFYPGGKVEYTAYIPLLELLAEQGYTCFIPKMPGNLAVFGVNKADNVMTANTDIEKWYLAGHSLGGAMASTFVSKNSDKLLGIVLLGAYPSSDISNTNVSMLSIVGSKDKIINRENYEKNKTNAPEGAVYKTLEGGNHANYGDYGIQEGDGDASISREKQMQQTAAWMKEFCQ